MTGETANERPKARLLFIELAAATLVRAAEVAAVVLIVVLVVATFTALRCFPSMAHGRPLTTQGWRTP